MPDAIHNFTTLHIAIHRPVKRTFVVFSWEAEVRKWIPYTDDLPDLRLKRSSVSTQGVVHINMATRRYREAINIAVSSNDHYLTAGNIDIVIVKKTGTQLPQGYMKRDYPAPPTTAEVEITDKELWTVREAEQPAGLAALATAAQQQQQQPPPVFKTILKPIPQRIAWLIAEDSSKSKETCAITTDEISPITAAVTTCFHVFEYESIQEWVNKNPARPTCPVCREVCAITKAFEG